MNPLRLAQLEMFCAVVETGTVVAASRKLNCVASNVTARLRELEQLLGQELFAREKNRLLLAPEGRLFYQQAKVVVDQARQLTDLFSEGTPKGVLTVGALDVALKKYLPDRVPRFLASAPGVEIRVLIRPTDTLERMLVDGDIDLALTDGPIEHPMMGSAFAFRERLAIVLPKGQDALQSGQAVFLFNTDCLYRRYFEAWLEEGGVGGGLIHTIESYDVILACVEAGLGISCIPQSVLSVLKAERHADVNVLYPDDLQGSDIYAVWREPGLGPLGQIFVDSLKTAVS
ncbi:LysR family transcriptional regulator [Gluconobacter oxydans]|uniref:LysR family transcriptional regulator n=1 Tax=Gluconobacter thailandicus TaxID=257438 RepID=UPI000299644A|nr:LysR family transcriptional regulator [Gluconobacter thailandicus]AFV99927.1 transcriptional regulator [Gluconobacter oxydans H24]ANQ41253.1 LysR family transcriptional regulator [Gluconobacter oxydans]